MRILPRESFRVCGAVRRRAIEITRDGDRRDADRRTARERPLEIVIARLALPEAEPPAIVMNDDRDVIGIVERLRRAIEGRAVERPQRRRVLPYEFVEVVA